METVSRDGESRDVERLEMERVGPREEERLEMERVTRDVERLRGGRRSCTARQSLQSCCVIMQFIISYNHRKFRSLNSVLRISILYVEIKNNQINKIQQ